MSSPVGYRAWALGLLGLAGGLLAEIRHVPQEYPSIQSALDAVVDDDTVLVSLGNYAEELLAPPLRFWLLGDVPVDTGDFPRPLIDPSPLDSARWRRCIFVPDGCELTLERLAFVNRASMYPPVDSMEVKGIEVHSLLPTTVRYCRFDSCYHAISCPGWEDQAYQLVVEDCRFTHATRSQVRVRSLGTVEVTRSSFDGRHYFGNLINAGTFSQLTECVFTGSPMTGAVYLSGMGLVVQDCVFGPLDSLRNWAALTVLSTANALIERNVFHHIQCSRSAVVLNDGGGGPATFCRNVLTNLTTWYWPQATVAVALVASGSHQGFRAVIDSNLFENNTQLADYAGKALALTDAVRGNANRFVDLEPLHGPTVDNSFGTDGSELRFNRFQAGDLAVRSFPYALDAVNNYWGHPSGPFNALHNPEGQGASVDDAVLFEPWSPDTNFLSVPGFGKPLPEAFILEAYPNPFNNVLHLTLIPSHAQIVKLELFDVLGRRVSEVWRGPLAFQKELNYDASGLSSGLYFVRVTDVIARQPLATAKLVLLK